MVVHADDAEADAYMEFLKPHRKALLKKSAALGREMLREFPGVTFKELAVEIAVRIPAIREKHLVDARWWSW